MVLVTVHYDIIQSQTWLRLLFIAIFHKVPHCNGNYLRRYTQFTLLRVLYTSMLHNALRGFGNCLSKICINVLSNRLSILAGDNKLLDEA